jgi:predicted regulator of Ras-like GTPase activity (Roadblock/LC7/MglB family)
MAARKAPDLRKQVEIDTRIPDVFSKSKISSRVHIAAQAPAAPEPPAPPPEPAPAPVAATGPAQIVEYLRALDGVAGVFIATADGLMVASDVPNANENVLAAFAPTVFAQLTKYADMARIGLPESIDIHLGDGATVHVRKAGKLFLGVLALRDRPLPIQELIRISAALQPRAS